MDHQALYREKLRTPEEAVRLVKDGDWVDYSQTCSFPQALDKALAARSGELKDVKVRNAIAMLPIATVENDPGHSFTYNAWHCSGLDRKYIDQCRAFHTPMLFRHCGSYYRKGYAPVDVAMVTVAPMDRYGNFSFGLTNCAQQELIDRDQYVAGNNKYYYSYCSNFSMTEDDVKELGFENGEIITMESDKPLGPFKFRKGVLKNPGAFFAQGGNNHHCMFEFDGKFYVAYHARILEEAMGIDGGYRSTNIDFMGIDADGGPAVAKGTREGVEQVGYLDPYTKVSASTMGNAAGIDTVSFADRDGAAPDVTYGDMIVTGIHSGSWTGVIGADFGKAAPKEIAYEVCGTGKGSISVRTGSPEGKEIALIDIQASGSDVQKFTASVTEEITGVNDIYFVFDGEGFKAVSWMFR